MKKGKNNSAKKESVNLKTTPNADRVNAILAADPEYQKISERYDQLRQILAKLWADIQANDSPTNPAISQYTRTSESCNKTAGLLLKMRAKAEKEIKAQPASNPLMDFINNY